MEFTGERMISEFNIGSTMYLEHVNRYLFAAQFVKDRVVLDIACGSGYGAEILFKAGSKKVIGVDISSETIDYCKTNYTGIDFLVGSVEKIPLESESVDVIISFETIEHVDISAQDNFMKEIKRVLKKEGVLIISTPNALVYEKGNEFHEKELSFEEFETLLKKQFSDYKMYFQDSVDSNYIFSEKEINENSENSNKFKFMRIKNSSPWLCRYLIAVCGGVKNDEHSGIAMVSDVTSIRRPAN